MKTTKEKIAVMQAFEEGKKIERGDPTGSCWRRVEDPSWNWSDFDYRISAEQKLRPWRPEEAQKLIGVAIIRYKGRTDAFGGLLGGVTPDGYHTIGSSFSSFEDGAEQDEYSLDNGKTWQPCGVLEWPQNN